MVLRALLDLALAVAIANQFISTQACTNLIVTRGAAVDNSTIFSYTADSFTLYGTLGHYPRAKHSPGTRRKIYNWDTGKYLGEIEEAPETYNVIGNLNEHGLAIGETTFGGNETLAGVYGVLDYGSLIWVTLQRAKTARQAIEMFNDLVTEYGYVSSGESFTIADAGEVWVMELIGKGNIENGAVWVAVRIPDGHVSGHANQARIQQFPLDDPDNCKYSKDVISFATKIGLWDASRPSSEFSFAETYDPITFSGARLSDARVWSFFNSVAEDPTFGKNYVNYVLGQNVSANNRMPLSIKPARTISAVELMMHMRNHYEGTPLDSRADVGAGSSGTVFRHRPLMWKYGDESYVNERSVGTPQAGWSFIAQLRGHLPAPIGGLLWFGVDDASFSVHVPFHGGVTEVPKGFADGTGDALTFSTESAFWAFNTVANFVYPRWYLAEEVMNRAHATETGFADALIHRDAKALEVYKVDPNAAMIYLTEKDGEAVAELVKDEFALFKELMVKYRDGVSITSFGPGAPDHGGSQGGVVPSVGDLPYASEWYGRIVKETGDHYKVKDGSNQLELQKLRVLSKGITSSLDSGVKNADIII